MKPESKKQRLVGLLDYKCAYSSDKVCFMKEDVVCLCARGPLKTVVYLRGMDSPIEVDEAYARVKNDVYSKRD